MNQILKDYPKERKMARADSAYIWVNSRYVLIHFGVNLDERTIEKTTVVASFEFTTTDFQELAQSINVEQDILYRRVVKAMKRWVSEQTGVSSSNLRVVGKLSDRQHIFLRKA